MCFSLLISLIISPFITFYNFDKNEKLRIEEEEKKERKVEVKSND